MSHRFTIDTLKELIAVRRDSEEGLRICAEYVQSARLQAMLLIHLHDCTQAVQELQSLVRLLGGDPGAGLSGAGLPGAGLTEPRGTNAAAAHRRWIELRAALACHEDGVILDECERGESRALEVYRNAMDDPLPDLVRAIVLRQFEDVMTNHDQIHDLRSQPSIRADLATGTGAQAGQH
ncbi:MAG: aldehyde dehydrogenase [Gammaproteobacteria bacterium]|nr:aldehyde dehydrogenase [Gammaproteobacteria bacterium]